MINWNIADDYYRCLKLEVEEQSRKSANEATELATQLGKERSCNEEQYHFIKHLKAKIQLLEASLSAPKDSPDFTHVNPPDSSYPIDPRKSGSVDLNRTKLCDEENCERVGSFISKDGTLKYCREHYDKYINTNTLPDLPRACSVEGCRKFGQFQFCGIWVCHSHQRTIEINWRRNVCE